MGFQKPLKTFKKRRQAVVRKPKKPMRYQVADIAYKGLKTALWVKKLINVEFKFVDFQTTLNVDYNGVFQFLNDSAQGDADNQHNGDSILNKHITMRGMIFRNGEDAVTRIIVFKDKANSITASTELLVQSGTVYAPFGMREKDYRDRYTVVSDTTYSVTSNDPQAVFHIELPLETHTKFLGATNTITSNAYRFLVISNKVTTNLPVLEYCRRASFVDN